MKRFIFTSHTDLTKDLPYPHDIASKIASIIHASGSLMAQPRLEGNNKQLLDYKGTWKFVTHSAYTFELTRSEEHGIDGLEALSGWLLFILKDKISPTW